MPTYDLRCQACAREWDRICPIVDRAAPCDACGGAVEQLYRPRPTWPFKPYFDVCLGRPITSLADRWTAQRQLNVQERDRMSKGDRSARLDRIAQGTREARR